MTKLRIFATAIALTILSSSTISALGASAPKPGAACAKAGLVVTISSTKYTCVKSGKKLVWNKGVAVLAKPSASPTPVPPTITLDNLDKDWTSKTAQAAVLNKLSSLPAATTITDLVSGANVRASEKALELELSSPGVKLFQEYYSPDKYTILLFSELDGAWANEQFAKYGLKYQNQPVSESIKNLAGRDCNFAGVNFNVEKTFFECTNSNKIRNTFLYQTPVHEYFHLVQASMIKEMQVPAWMIEGSAAFFGEIVGYRNESNPLGTRLGMNIQNSYDFDPANEGLDMYRFRTWAKNAKSADVISLYKSLEVRRVDNGNKYAWYAVGSIATEALVASFGFDGYMKVWTNMKQGQDFQTAFKSAFGLTAEEFYVKLTPFINTKF